MRLVIAKRPLDPVGIFRCLTDIEEYGQLLPHCARNVVVDTDHSHRGGSAYVHDEIVDEHALRRFQGQPLCNQQIAAGVGLRHTDVSGQDDLVDDPTRTETTQCTSTRPGATGIVAQDRRAHAATTHLGDHRPQLVRLRARAGENATEIQDQSA